MKKRSLKPAQTAPVERPQAGSTSRDPLAMFAAGGVGASTSMDWRIPPPPPPGTSMGWQIPPPPPPFAGDDAE